MKKFSEYKMLADTIRSTTFVLRKQMYRELCSIVKKNGNAVIFDDKHMKPTIQTYDEERNIILAYLAVNRVHYGPKNKFLYADTDEFKNVPLSYLPIEDFISVFEKTYGQVFDKKILI